MYREYLRAARGFANYNFRAYFERRAHAAFRDGANELTEETLAKARSELLVLQRQAQVSQMYHFDKLVVEKVED